MDTLPPLGAPKGWAVWQIRLSLGRGPDGKYKQKCITFHGTREQMEQKRAELVYEISRDEFIEPSKVLFADWLDTFLNKSVKTQKARSTFKSYCSIVNVHIKPKLGHLRLQALKPFHFEEYYATVDVEARSKVLHKAVITCALKAAINAGLLRNNVADRAANKPKLRKIEDKLDKVWTEDEAKRFLKTVKDLGTAQDAAFFGLALDAGLRRGELLGLQWKDLDGSSLRVERQLLGIVEDEKGAFTLDTSLPKGKCARTVDLGDETVRLLREHKRQQAELKMKNRLRYVDLDMMFSQEWEDLSDKNSRLGLPLRKNSINYRLDRLCQTAGVKRITPHGLRHMCATLLMLEGVPPKVVQERLGHADASMTVNVYSHVLPSMQRDAARRLERRLHV
jgi:integrase